MKAYKRRSVEVRQSILYRKLSQPSRHNERQTMDVPSFNPWCVPFRGATHFSNVVDETDDCYDLQESRKGLIHAPKDSRDHHFVRVLRGKLFNGKSRGYRPSFRSPTAQGKGKLFLHVYVFHH